VIERLNVLDDRVLGQRVGRSKPRTVRYQVLLQLAMLVAYTAIALDFRYRHHDRHAYAQWVIFWLGQALIQLVAWRRKPSTLG
jgi:hypothetical protein